MSSLPVSSNQMGPHDDLEKTVLKHLRTRFQRPIPDWVEILADRLVKQAEGRPVILDSGCGTGHSSHWLSGQHPGCFVIGVDQSADRLSRSPASQTSAGQNVTADSGSGREAVLPLALVQADVQDLWRALLARGIRLKKHTIFYPNPWPKAHHFMRRWHGHPVWPSLLALGGELELRTNWLLYAQEFSAALALSGVTGVQLDSISENRAIAQPVSLFEKKYALSGHTLWSVRADLNPV